MKQADSAREAPTTLTGTGSDNKRAWLKRGLTAVIAVAVATLIVREALQTDWRSVGAAIREYDAATIALGLALLVPAYLACSAFDLIGRRATGHTLPVGRTMLLSYTGYVFSLNLGALIGGVAFRYRLYMPYGFSHLSIGQIIGLSVLTNWLGFCVLAGIVLCVEPPELPAGWGVGTAALRATGVAFLAAALVYGVACALKGGTLIRHEHGELRLPTPGTAAVQLALSTLSWGAIGTLITWLLPGEVGWFTVMPVLMVSAVAGIWSHVPGGLGVTEAVFVALLGGAIAEADVLAALLLFRALYYLLPFAVGIVAYAYLETSARRDSLAARTDD